MKARDTNDTARLRDLKWNAAIGRWQEGDGEPLRVLLLAARGVVPAFAREFLADVVTGAAKRRQGRPDERTPEHKRQIWQEVMLGMDAGESQADAIARVAEQRGLPSDGPVRRIVADMGVLGLTRDLWTEKMRPR